MIPIGYEDPKSRGRCMALLSFGVVADIQYADKSDGYEEGRNQRYREAPGKLAQAVTHFNNVKQELSFVLTLGDIIDGNDTKEQTRADFDVVLKELSKLEVPAIHLLGNHCLSLPREILLKELAMPARYYRRDLIQGWALVVLDSMDMSIQWPENSTNYMEAMEFLKAHPLGEQNPQMSFWNGGIGKDQLKWLQHILSDAERDAVKLIIAQHHPIVPHSAPSSHLLWNHKELFSILLKSCAVAVFLCGHYHPGGYACVDGKHFVTIEAILEAPSDCQAHGIVRLYPDKLCIQGFGTVKNRNMSI